MHPRNPAPSPAARHRGGTPPLAAFGHFRPARVLPLLVVLALSATLLAVAAGPAAASVFDNTVKWPTDLESGYVIVPVCIAAGSSTEISPLHPNTETPPSLDAVVGRVRWALSTSWERHSSVRFVGWKNCSDPSVDGDETMPFYIHPDVGNSSLVGIHAKGTHLTGNRATSIKPFGNESKFNSPADCYEYDASDAQWRFDFACAEQYARHEFGHALGFRHEWRHWLTPDACSELQNPNEQPEVKGTFEILNEEVYDWDSLMTYDDACAHVTGRRFGSPNLSPRDIAGLQAAYPPVELGADDVGVLLDRESDCPDGKLVTIHLDNEDDDADTSAHLNALDGWTGAITSGRNTTFRYCRVAAEGFGTLRQTEAGTADYALLRLGEVCPSGSQPFTRYHDDQDAPPLNENWMSGEFGPTRQNFDGGTGTELHYCLFVSSTSPTMYNFPDLGYDYGVLAGENFTAAAETGSVTTDDEDTNNENRLTPVFEGPALSAVRPILPVRDSNTRYALARVVANHAPMVEFDDDTASTEGSAVSFDVVVEDPDGDTLRYDWDFGDGTTLADGPASASHTYADEGTGTYTVQLTVSDPWGGSASATTVHQVTNAAPEVDAGSALTADEGQPVHLASASFSDAGSEDTHSATIEWEDGSPTSGDVDQDAHTITGSHTYGTDGAHTAAVCVEDNDGGEGCDDVAVTINNLPPQIATTASQVEGDEGSEVTTNGTYTDPGDDPVTVTASIGTVTTSDGSWTWTHTPSDGDASEEVVITAADDGGASSTATFVLVTDNVAPFVSTDSPSIVVDEGTEASNTGTFGDMGTDTVVVTASVGAIDQDGFDAGPWGWTYTPAGPDETQTVVITATDSDGESASTSFDLTVRNVAPTVTLSGSDSADEADTVAYSFSASDPGADAFSVLAQSCGTEGALTNATFDPDTGSGSFDCTFPNGDATSVVSVQLEDSDGAVSNISTIGVDVRNLAPVVDAGDDQEMWFSEEVSITGWFDDLGPDAPWTIDIDWGDGSVDSSTSMAPGPISEHHQYSSPGDRVVEVCVTDRDSATSCDELAAVMPDLRSRTQAVRDDVDDLLSIDNDDEHLRAALNDLDEALDPERWTDGNHLESRYGDRVFSYGRKAVRELERMTSDLHPIIDRIVKIQRTLAVLQIDETADQLAADPNPQEMYKAWTELAAAEEELARGDAEHVNGEHRKASSAYREAWELALKATRKGA